jgi:hypothetical protein
MVLSDCAPWQSNHSTRRGEVHRNKIEISAGVIELSLSKKKEINGPVLAVEILIDPVLLSKKRKAVNFKPFSTVSSGDEGPWHFLRIRMSPLKKSGPLWRQLPWKWRIINFSSIQ